MGRSRRACHLRSGSIGRSHVASQAAQAVGCSSFALADSGVKIAWTKRAIGHLMARGPFIAVSDNEAVIQWSQNTCIAPVHIKEATTMSNSFRRGWLPKGLYWRGDASSFLCMPVAR